MSVRQSGEDKQRLRVLCEEQKKRIAELESTLSKTKTVLKVTRGENVRLRGNNINMKESLLQQQEIASNATSKLHQSTKQIEKVNAKNRKLTMVGKLRGGAIAAVAHARDEIKDMSEGMRQHYIDLEKDCLELKDSKAALEAEKEGLLAKVARVEQELAEAETKNETQQREISGQYNEISQLRTIHFQHQHKIMLLKEDNNIIAQKADVLDKKLQAMTEEKKGYATLLRQLSCRMYIRMNALRKRFMEQYQELTDISCLLEEERQRHTPQKSATELSPRSMVQYKQKAAKQIYVNSGMPFDLAGLCSDEINLLRSKVIHSLKSMDSLRATAKEFAQESVEVNEKCNLQAEQMELELQKLKAANDEIESKKAQESTVMVEIDSLHATIKDLKLKIKRTEAQHKKDLLRITVDKNKEKVHSLSVTVGHLIKDSSFNSIEEIRQVNREEQNEQRQIEELKQQIQNAEKYKASYTKKSPFLVDKRNKNSPMKTGPEMTLKVTTLSKVDKYREKRKVVTGKNNKTLERTASVAELEEVMFGGSKFPLISPTSKPSTKYAKTTPKSNKAKKKRTGPVVFVPGLLAMPSR